jgi:hypothetical protein
MWSRKRFHDLENKEFWQQTDRGIFFRNKMFMETFGLTVMLHKATSKMFKTNFNINKK